MHSHNANIKVMRNSFICATRYKEGSVLRDLVAYMHTNAVKYLASRESTNPLTKRTETEIQDNLVQRVLWPTVVQNGKHSETHGWY